MFKIISYIIGNKYFPIHWWLVWFLLQLNFCLGIQRIFVCTCVKQLITAMSSRYDTAWGQASRSTLFEYKWFHFYKNGFITICWARRTGSYGKHVSSRNVRVTKPMKSHQQGCLNMTQTRMMLTDMLTEKEENS